jgi:hypothetical protein
MALPRTQLVVRTRRLLLPHTVSIAVKLTVTTLSFGGSLHSKLHATVTKVHTTNDTVQACQPHSGHGNEHAYINIMIAVSCIEKLHHLITICHMTSLHICDSIIHPAAAVITSTQLVVQQPPHNLLWHPKAVSSACSGGLPPQSRFRFRFRYVLHPWTAKYSH